MPTVLEGKLQSIPCKQQHVTQVRLMPNALREAAALLAQEAADKEAEEQARLAALEAETDSQSTKLPLTVDEWRAQIISLINDEAGDRFELVQFFRAVRLFDPNYAVCQSQ